MFEETDYAINFSGYSHGLGIDAYGAGSIVDAILAYDDPGRLHEINEQKLKNNIRRISKIIDVFGDYIQIVTVADDMGTQNGPMCSPDYVETFCMPYYRKLCDFIHANSDIKILLHSCGAIKQMIPMIIDAGFNIINPVQISAENMNPQKLKAEFGEQICFWGGGCDTQKILGTGAPRQVSENVSHLVRIFKENSGYVFNQVHNIMGNVPPENIIAMLDTAYCESFSIAK
ncbi:MAG: uroporphyrinogen decarboxylase family protein [Victivallaceae bacterium]